MTVNTIFHKMAECKEGWSKPSQCHKKNLTPSLQTCTLMPYH